jgi:hypothetical protein
MDEDAEAWIPYVANDVRPHPRGLTLVGDRS